jgi:stage III sporulation protein SpoIIIAA
LIDTPPLSDPFVTSAQDDLSVLLSKLPAPIRSAIEEEPDADQLLEVILDLGRFPAARFAYGETLLDTHEVTDRDLAHVVGQISPFGDDNRAGIERTLHRISAIRNRAHQIVGLTCRVGRAIYGTIDILEDLVTSGKSVLLVGRPGVGKTTMLREVARILADTAKKRVIIVDTSNEIAGDGDIPHPAIGRARRMQVTTTDMQHAVMIQAVENHMPEVIIIDEMGTEQEAAAARTIAERGVQLIATAHGNALENLLVNPTLSDLVGGIQAVTLGDEEARRRRSQKTILERKAPPTFDVLVEIQSWERVAVHLEVGATVDRLLRYQPITVEIRWIGDQGEVRCAKERRPPAISTSHKIELPSTIVPSDRSSISSRRPPVNQIEPAEMIHAPNPPVTILPFGVGKDRLIHIASTVGVNITVAEALLQADLVLTTRSHYKKRNVLLRNAEKNGTPVFVLTKNDPGQIKAFLEHMSHHNRSRQAPEPLVPATNEANHGVEQVLNGKTVSVELSPQNSYIRRVQHQIAEQAQLHSSSLGKEPRRRVVIER